MKLIKLVVILFLFSNILNAFEIKFDKIYGNQVWHYKQLITGTVSSDQFTKASVMFNGTAYDLEINSSNKFAFNITLNRGANSLYLLIDSAGVVTSSDTLQLNLLYKTLPEVFAFAEVSGSNVTLKSRIDENPYNENLQFIWNEDPANPSTGLVNNTSGAEVIVNLDANLTYGEYYFNLYAINDSGDTVKSRTYVTVNETGLRAFDIKTDHAKWIDDAIIYQTTPYIFVESGKFYNITKKIPELASLGINTIYLQPIFATKNKGQGYDITDYFKIRPDLGNENDLRDLIKTAKENGMKVIIDFVPNHSSIEHYFAKHASQYGESSHYYDYYQRKKDISPYASNERVGNGFVYYFDWSNMPNLNYDNIEVQNYMISAMQYWVEDFGVDGYRFDAVWAVTARNPQFTRKMRLALKKVKPEILLLAEDKAAQPQAFDERFDVAYDWSESYDWVSQWMFQTVYSPYQSVFMGEQKYRSMKLRNSLSNYGKGYSPDAKILRFIENNDMDRFINIHGIERTKMAAAMMFTLNGVPMLYNGQEVGLKVHPYSAWMIYWDQSTMQYQDRSGLLPFYKRLMEIRKIYPALRSSNYEEITTAPDSYNFAYRRWLGNENIITVMNMGDTNINLRVELPLSKLNLDTTKTYFLTELQSGKIISGKVS
ncbi:MAG: alpha-amylase family glycosyl hydrolase [Melioribacteraceae bacterium]|nr:alpha-amylase family glycosyl hydrolase [Melioribacteraceae bacterium]